MASTETFTMLPHLVRDTTNVSSNLGPAMRSQTWTDHSPSYLNSKVMSASAPVEPVMKYPRIIVRDFCGRTLDTFTTLQEAIYRANWSRKKRGEWPKTPLEWRLPKAPVPSRPDYSRAEPKFLATIVEPDDLQRDLVSESHLDQSQRKNIDMFNDVSRLEIAVDDVAFVAESLSHLPKMPAFSFLRQSILAGQATYIQIVASILLHQKHLQATEHREPQWEFPGFCYGCKRAGFCYGCSKSSKPHVHEDVPAMIGGGYRFYKRDRPNDSQDWKHPGNWGLPSAERELRNVIKQYGGLSEFEQAAISAERQITRSPLGSVEDDTKADGTSQDFLFQRLISLNSPFATIVRSDSLEDRKEDNERRSGRKKKVSINDKTFSSNRKDSVLSEVSADKTLVQVDNGYFEGITEDDMKDVQSEERETNDKDSKVSRQRSRTLTSSSRARSESSGTTATRKSGRLDYIDKEKEQLEEDQMRLRREKAKQNVPFGKKRKDTGYTAPKFFTVQKQQRKITVAKDPFSTDRDLNVPQGPGFQLKKSDKKPTQFMEFKRNDQEKDHIGSKSLSETEKGHGRRRKGTHDDDENQDGKSRRKHGQDLSPDSGLDDTTSSQKKDYENDGTTKTDEGNQQNSLKQRRKEIVKKTRDETSSHLESRPPPSQSPVLRSDRSPSLVDDTLQSNPEIKEPLLPELYIPTIPLLPEITDVEASNERKKEKLKFTVGLPPPTIHQTKEEPKIRRAAPKVRVIPKNLYKAKRKSCPAEAPVTAEELIDIQDPLDFLAKWSIINPDRLPFYEIIFESIVAEQSPKYTKPQPPQPPPPEQTAEKVDVDHKDGESPQEKENEMDKTVKEGKEKKTKKKKSKTKNDEDNNDKKGIELKPDLFPTERGMSFVKSTMTIEEQHLDKLIYTLNLLQNKMVKLTNSVEELQRKRIKKLASKAREMFPVLMSPNFEPDKKRGKKGKKKDKDLSEPSQKLKPQDITDSVIVDRLDDKMLKELCQDPEMKLLESEIEILREKIKEVQRRVEEMAKEKILTDAFCMNHYFMRQEQCGNQSESFKRQQSAMYNRLHPSPDFEMNLEEVEDALQQVNNHLMTKNEFHFLYNILNLPGREKINFRLFTVIAALSEKVTQLDPVIRKMVNNFNYNALDIKMEKCKELFDLLEMSNMPRGAAQAESLAVELAAGGLIPEHTRYVLNKFNRENKGAIDFLDFVTYVPLFVEIHKRIIQDPLKEDFSL